MADQNNLLGVAQGSPDEFQTLMIAEAHERFPQANGHSRPAFIAGAKWAKEFLAARPPADPVETDGDPTANPAWNDGCDFAMTQLCAFLGVNQNDVRWDAATETVEGDVQAVIGNILRAKFGEDWGAEDHPRSSAETDRLKVTAPDPHATICKALCQSKVFETGQGTCAPACMDQLGDARKRGCYHAPRVHDRIALAILEALAETGEVK